MDFYICKKKGKGEAISAMGGLCKIDRENETIKIGDKYVVSFEKIKCIFMEVFGNTALLINAYRTELDACYEIMDELQKDLSHS